MLITVLHLAENGYLTLTNRLIQKFIKGNELEEDFFDKDLGYPVMISEDTTKISSNLTRKITHNIFLKLFVRF